MRDPQRINNKPRPWSVPRLQRAVGNRAIDRILNPSAAPQAPPPEPEPAQAQAQAPSRWKLGALLPLVAAVAGGAAGYAIEQTGAARYAGPALGAALAALACVWWSIRREQAR
jgi:hypothetical protein